MRRARRSTAEAGRLQSVSMAATKPQGSGTRLSGSVAILILTRALKALLTASVGLKLEGAVLGI